ncbi:hypothetical protein [Halalkalibacter kiskunsagensis]|uniref:hypothetical protein n=1 Tax=Halalkalibacter kiskunsagensis TaxID=1548599 RepID=UPI00300B5587
MLPFLEIESMLHSNNNENDYYCEFILASEKIIIKNMEEHKENKLFCTKSKLLLDQFNLAKHDLNTLLRLVINSTDLKSYTNNEKIHILQSLIFRRFYDLNRNRVRIHEDTAVYYTVPAKPSLNLNKDNKKWLCCSLFLTEPFNSFGVYLEPSVYESIPEVGLVTDQIPRATLVNDVYPEYFWHKYKIGKGSKKEVPDLYDYSFNKKFLP